MMNKLFSLIKTDLNTTYGLSAISYSFKSKKNRWQSIIFAFALLSLLPSYVLIVRGLNGMFDIYSELGQQSMFLLSGFLGTQGVVFFFGLLYVMSKYYFANDLNHLIPLPIKPSYILGSKFVTLMVSEYLTSLPIILPFIFIYGTKSGEGILYWIYSALLVLTLPVISLVLASILVMVFMRYTNIGKRKDLLRVVGGIVLLIGIIYFQFKMQEWAGKNLMDENFLLQLVKDSNLLVKKLGLIFPPSMWAALSLTNPDSFTGLFHLFSFIGVGLIGFTIMMLLSEKLFFGGLIGNIEVSSSKGKNGKKVSLEKSTLQTKPYIALAKKELIMLFKTPVYLLNSVGGVIILPILLPIIIGGDEGIDAFMGLIGLNQDLIALAGIGFIMSLGMLNSIGATTFSREGKNFWIQRVLPIKPRDQIIGRVISSLAVQGIGVIALITSLLFLIDIQIKTIIIIAIIGLLGSIPMTQLGMLIDIIRPYLTWDNPQRAMKQNLNVLIAMGVGSLYGGGIGYLTFKSIDKIDINIIFLSLIVVFILSVFIFYKILEKLIEKQFKEFE